jgi:hypothetical protein
MVSTDPASGSNLDNVNKSRVSLNAILVDGGLGVPSKRSVIASFDLKFCWANKKPVDVDNVVVHLFLH